jgi:hypothetical protein
LILSCCDILARAVVADETAAAQAPVAVGSARGSRHSGAARASAASASSVKAWSVMVGDCPDWWRWADFAWLGCPVTAVVAVPDNSKTVFNPV